MTIGSLFSGVGGLELGLERAGLGPTLWQCERDPFARSVLAKHWPNATRYDDVTVLKDPPYVDILCGGFPCQNVSNSGDKAGLDGDRSGLWREYVRLIRHVRPRYVVVENVAALLVRGMGRVLGDLAASGYDAEWDCIPASSVGARHHRDRVFILAYPSGVGHAQSRDDWRDARNLAASRCWETTDALDALARGAVPVVCRDHDGIPRGLAGEHLRVLGNAVVPAVGEVIGRVILARERSLATPR